MYALHSKDVDCSLNLIAEGTKQCDCPALHAALPDHAGAATIVHMCHLRMSLPPAVQSWSQSCVSGLCMLLQGSTVLIPFLIVPPMGGTPEDLAAGGESNSWDCHQITIQALAALAVRPNDGSQVAAGLSCVCALKVISTIFFISGIVTLLQTLFGDRLPIIQASIPPVAA